MIPPCKGGQPAANHVLIMRPFCLLGKMGSGGIFGRDALQKRGLVWNGKNLPYNPEMERE
jgi:hypothetical protein